MTPFSSQGRPQPVAEPSLLSSSSSLFRDPGADDSELSGGRQTARRPSQSLAAPSRGYAGQCGFLTSHPISIVITNSAPLLHKPHFEDLIATWGQRPPDRTAETPSLFIRVQSPRAQSFYTEFGGRRFSYPSLCSHCPCRPNKLEERRLTEESSLPVSEEGLSKSLRVSPVLCTQERRCGEDEVGILPSGSFPDLMKGAQPC